MAPDLDNLGWFYRGKAEQSMNLPESLEHKVFYFLLATFSITGVFAITSYIFHFLRLLSSLFVLPGRPLRTFGQPSKTWALVTGASDGIGKEFALQLSRAGYSTLLVSRTASKLDTLAAEIKSKYNTQMKTLAMDFSANSDDDYARLKALVDSLDVAVLINNVGISHNIPVPFLQTTREEMENIIMVNCMATLRVTQLVAVGMAQRKRGLILTMGSFGGLIPSPLLATYSGSKAFLQQWSTALGCELAPSNVTVELVQSYLVTSAMSKIRRSSATVPSPRAFVRSVLDSIGRTRGAQGWAYSCTPYWSHALMQWGISMFISPANKYLVLYTRWMHYSIRKRALAKQERNKGKKSE